MPVRHAREVKLAQPVDTYKVSGIEFPAPFWSARGATVYLGGVNECLRRLPARSVHCCITSPPYWSLRSYLPNDHADKTLEIGAEPSADCGTHGRAQCGGCYVCALVAVFREVRRVLRDDGVCWLNLGDTYQGDSGDHPLSMLKGQTLKKRYRPHSKSNAGLPPGNLVGIPWRVALAMQNDGWILRSDMPWVKRRPMPESATNRPGKSLEYIFLFAKSQDYYFDMDAVRSPAASKGGGSRFGKLGVTKEQVIAAGARGSNRNQGTRPKYETRSFRNSDLWFQSVEKPNGVVGIGDEIVGIDHGPANYPGAHFAVFSPKLITPLILAGTSAHGCCVLCGKQWERAISRTVNNQQDKETGARAQFDYGYGLINGYKDKSSKTLGWRKVCGCENNDVVPPIVLDPFVGSGTTVSTALQLGRAGIGVDISEKYLLENAIVRIETALAGGVIKKPTVAIPDGTAPLRNKLAGAE